MRNVIVYVLCFVLILISLLIFHADLQFFAPFDRLFRPLRPTEQALIGGKQWLLKAGEISICAVPIPIGNYLFYHDLQIFLARQTLFSDTNAIFTTNNDRLPLVRKLDTQQHYEILLGMMEMDRQSRILQLLADKNRVYYKDTLPMISPIYNAGDYGEFPKFGGFWFEPETYCQLCDSTYYNPFLIYEMMPNGFRLDTTATRQWILQHYNDFYGYKPNQPFIVLQKEINKTIDT